VSVESPKPKYVRVAELRARYGGVSDMWFVRKMRDEGFPQPVYFGGRDRFWNVEALDEWDRAKIAAGPTSPRRKVAS
jgi:predicted DNA-binding transcriptional regulator AlpA